MMDINQTSTIDIPPDILRLTFEIAAEADMKFARDVLLFVNREVQIWIEWQLYRVVALPSTSRVRRFTRCLSLKPPAFQATATRTLILPSITDTTDLVFLFSTLKRLKNLSWTPAPAVPMSVKGLVADLRVERLRTRLGAFDTGGDGGGVGVSDMRQVPKLARGERSGRGLVLPHGMLDGVKQLVIVDSAEVWVRWDWKALLGSREGGGRGVEWIGLCAEDAPRNKRGTLQLKCKAAWEVLDPRMSADVRPFVDVADRGRVCICCVKYRRAQGGVLHETTRVVGKTTHYGSPESWMALLGVRDEGGWVRWCEDGEEGGAAGAGWTTGQIFGSILPSVLG